MQSLISTVAVQYCTVLYCMYACMYGVGEVDLDLAWCCGCVADLLYVMQCDVICMTAAKRSDVICIGEFFVYAR